MFQIPKKINNITCIPHNTNTICYPFLFIWVCVLVIPNGFIKCKHNWYHPVLSLIISLNVKFIWIFTQILLVLCYGITPQYPKAFNCCYRKLAPSLFDFQFTSTLQSMTIYDISVMYFLPSLVYIYYTNQHFCSGFYFCALVAAPFSLFPKWSNLMIFLDNIIVSYIIHGYSSIWRSFNTTDIYWSFKNVTIACLVTIHIMRVILWCIFHRGCIDGILQSLNIAFIAAAIIVVTIFLFSINDMIFILFIIQNQIIMHGSKQFGAYAL